MTSPRDDQAMPPVADQPTTDPQLGGAPTSGQAPAGTPPRPVTPVRPHKVRRTRIGGTWVGLGISAVVLLLLLIFILENGKSVDIGYFGAHGHLPLGVALLLAAVAGAVLVLIPGTGRIIQLRRTARRHRASEASAIRAGQQAAAQNQAAAQTQQPGQPG